jgi:hypothetical protein
MKSILCALAAGALTLAAAEMKLGKPLRLAETTPIEKILATPDLFTGKAVQVKGKVTEVCHMMGCWMALKSDGGAVLRVKVNDGEIVFPKEAVGRMAIAEGTFTKIEMTQAEHADHAKHEAEEQGKKFDPATVKSGKTMYQIKGSGAVILN